MPLQERNMGEINNRKPTNANMFNQAGYNKHSSQSTRGVVDN